MPNSSIGQDQELSSPELTRRQFVVGVGASAAGAALLGCCQCKVTRGDVKTQVTHVHTKRPTCVAVVSDELAVTSDDDGKLIAWDISQLGPGRRAHEFTSSHHGKASFVVAHGGQGGRVFTSGYDGSVIIHSLKDPSNPKPPVFRGHRADGAKREVWVVTVSGDGRRALSATNDGQILLWDVDNPLSEPVRTFRYSKDAVAGLAFVPGEGPGRETMFLSTHGHGEIALWDIDQPEKPAGTFQHKNSHHVNAVVVTADGATFLSAGFDMTVRVWDLAGGRVADPKPEFIFRGPVGHDDRIWRVALLGTEKAATASDDGTVHVLDLQKKTITRSFDTRADRAKKDPPGGSMGVGFTPDGSRVVYTGTYDEKAPDTGKAVVVATA